MGNANFEILAEFSRPARILCPRLSGGLFNRKYGGYPSFFCLEG